MDVQILAVALTVTLTFATSVKHRHAAAKFVYFRSSYSVAGPYAPVLLLSESPSGLDSGQKHKEQGIEMSFYS